MGLEHTRPVQPPAHDPAWQTGPTRATQGLLIISAPAFSCHSLPRGKPAEQPLRPLGTLFRVSLLLTHMKMMAPSLPAHYSIHPSPHPLTPQWIPVATKLTTLPASHYTPIHSWSNCLPALTSSEFL